VIRVHDETGNVIETREHAGNFKKSAAIRAISGTGGFSKKKGKTLDIFRDPD
jgi:hypothetical protein